MILRPRRSTSFGEWGTSRLSRFIPPSVPGFIPTTQIQTTQQLIAAIRAKASQFQQGYNSRELFSGQDSNGQFVEFKKSQVTIKNMLVVTPANRNFPLSRIATDLEQLEGEFGLDEIVVVESTSLVP